METKLTIVTTTYNQEKFIKDALEGFVKQKTNFPFQVLISDDCSTDSTPEIINSYFEKYPEIIKPIFNKKNIGAMNNFINTLSLVKTKYVALCDGDDYWTDENKLQKQVDFLESHPEFSICFHQTEIFFENNSKIKELYPSKNIKENSTFDDLIKESYIPANTVVYRWLFTGKETIKNVFPPDIVPGDYFVHLLHAQKGKIHFIPKTLSRYRRHKDGIWWLTACPDGQESFHLKYGIKYLNFFDSVEKQFILSSNVFEIQKENLARNIIKYYILNKKFEELLEFKKKYPYLYDSYINDFEYDNIYESLGRFRRIIYLLLFNRKKFVKKVKGKFKI